MTPRKRREASSSSGFGDASIAEGGIFKRGVDVGRGRRSNGIMSNSKCESCRFFQGTYGIHGECRRNAPVRGESYPETATNHWCGQHDSRPGKGEAANMPSEVTPPTPPASPPPPAMDVIARLEAEATQLGDRTAKLQSFLADSAKTKSIPLEDKNDLVTQLVYMMSYQKVLKRRMNRYNRINALARAALTRANGCTSPGCCGGGTTNGESPP